MSDCPKCHKGYLKITSLGKVCSYCSYVTDFNTSEGMSEQETVLNTHQLYLNKINHLKYQLKSLRNEVIESKQKLTRLAELEEKLSRFGAEGITEKDMQKAYDEKMQILGEYNA